MRLWNTLFLGIMVAFDLLKKLFGWFDKRSRKRAAASPTIEAEYVTRKKFCCDHNSITKLSDDVTEINEESDNEDVEVIAQYKDACNGTGLNASHNSSNDISLKYCSATSSSTPKLTPMHRRRINMGCTSNSKPKSSSIGGEWRCPTLAKTDRMREKTQYEELLQNFLPQRIHVIHNKGNEPRPTPEVIDIIDLEKSTNTSTCSKQHQTSRIQELPSHSRWSVPRKSKKEAEVTILDVKKNKGESLGYEKPRICDIDITFVKSTPTKRIECVPSNTLRDQLAAKAVVRLDFIPEVSKRYDAKIEKRIQEAEKLMQMTSVLSKHNRLAREVALEKQLARSMKLCEAVLDEREEPEESEELALPALTENMLKEINRALTPRPPNEVLVEGFGLRITRKDINTLADLNWLNDEVINFYMNLLIQRGGKNNYPKLHAMNTFFYPKLLSGGHTSLKRWTKKIDVFAQDLLVVPIHLGIHWCMSIIDFRVKTIRYYDSMGSSNPKCLSALRQYLEDESLDKKKQPYNTNDWKLECVKNIPQQMNGSDCGVFSCMFAEYESANRKITFTQEDMPYFRHKMVYEILKSKLL